MKIKKIKEFTKKELQSLLAENREKLRQLKFDLVNKKVKNVRQIRDLKKDIARILTLLNKKNK